MPQNASPSKALSPSQLVVLDSLVSGNTVTAAAKAGTVDRSTVHRWFRNDFLFQAAFNAARHDIIREVESRLLSVATAATETINSAVKGGDIQAALSVLKGLGIFGSRLPLGLEDPREIEESEKAAADSRASTRLMQRLGEF